MKSILNAQNSLVILILILFTPPFTYGATNEIITINNFEVNLVDVESGNQVAIQYLVPVGSRMDPPHLAGRAHFLEHMVGKGSLRYPGYHTLGEITSKLGGSRNASTSLGWTNYFLKISETSVQKGLDLHFAGLAGPEFNSDVLKKELTAVDNEVNVESPSKPMSALFYSTVDALPKEHPLQRWDLGTSDIIDRMTVSDMKELFYGNYTPEFTKVVISANFKSGDIDKEQVKIWLKKYLIAPDTARDPESFSLTEEPLAGKNIKSLFTNNNTIPFLEYGTDDDSKLGFHSVESPAPYSEQDPLALLVLSTYLNSDATGSLQNRLRKKGWINSMGGSTEYLGDRAYYFFITYYTDKGWNHREEILETVYETLADIRDNGIDERTLDIIKGVLVDGFNKNFKNINSAMNSMRQIFTLKDENVNQLKFADAFKRISAKDLKLAVEKMFDPRNSLNVFMHKEVQSQTISPTFKRKLKKYDNSSLLNKIHTRFSQEAPALGNFRPIFPKIAPFIQRSVPLPIDSNDWINVSGNDDIILKLFKENHSSLEGAFYLSTAINNLDNLNMQVALDIFYTAFIDSLTDTLTVLASRGVHLNMGVSGDLIKWSGEGDAQSLTQSYRLISKMFSEYQPTDKELEQSKELYITDNSSNISSAFVGSLAASYAFSAFTKTATSPESLETASKLSPEKIRTEVKKIRMSSQPRLFMIGDFSKEDIFSLQSSSWNTLRYTFPHTKTTASPRVKQLSSVELAQQNLPKGKDLSTVGLARIYQGPKKMNMKANAAATVLGRYLHQKVFSLNRSEKGLGYVHGATASAIGPYKYFLFYGQADSSKKAELTIDGWNAVLNDLRNRVVDDEVWQQYKQGVIAELSLKPTSLLKEVAQIGANYRFSDSTTYIQDLALAVSQLSPDDIYHLADDHLLNRPPYYELQIRDCEALLEN